LKISREQSSDRIVAGTKAEARLQMEQINWWQTALETKPVSNRNWDKTIAKLRLR